MRRLSVTPAIAVVREPRIRGYWINSTVSSFGDNVASVALLLMVLRETGSVSAMATMSLIVAVPSIVFGVLSGVWVDRWDAKRVVVVSQAARAVLMLGFIYVDLGHALWFVYVLAFLQATVGTFDDPARARVVREITTDETRLSVNAFTSSGTRVAGILGTTAGGTLAGALDHFWPSFTVTSLAFAIGAFAFSRIDGAFVPAIPTAGDHALRPRFWPQVAEGFQVTRRSPVLLAVMLTASVSTFGLSAATIMLLPLIANVLDIQPGWFGAVEASQTAAMILTSLALGIIGHRIDPRHLVTLSMIGTGLGIVILSGVPSLWLLLPTMFLIGVALAPLGTSYSTLLQTHCPPTLIGRVAATLNTAIQAMSLLSMAVAGVAGDVAGVRSTIGAAGVLCVVAGGFAWTLLRRGTDKVASGSTA